jgi:hypothetical protein
MYGLKIDGDSPHFCKKDTTLLTNVPGLKNLALMCDGQHTHCDLMGPIRSREGWVRKTALAGVYPVQLCAAWAQCLK